MSPSVYHSYPVRSSAMLLGYVLLAAGIVLLFICIPGWIWLAALGIALIASGWIVLKMCSAWR